jgi:hypothetical protein
MPSNQLHAKMEHLVEGRRHVSPHASNPASALEAKAKKPGYLFWSSGNPAIFGNQRPVAFRPHLTMGLAIFENHYVSVIFPTVTEIGSFVIP